MFGNPSDTLIYRKRPYNRRRNVAALGGGAVVVPTMPSGLVFDMNSLAVTPQADNTIMSAFSDAVSGISIVPFATKEPKYRTSGYNGKPAFEFTGTQYFTIPGTHALKTAIDSQEYSVLVIADNVTAFTTSSVGVMFGATNGGSAFVVDADGAVAGGYATTGTNAAFRVPWANTGFLSTGFTSTNTASTTPYPTAAASQAFVFGIPFASVNSKGPATGGRTLSIGAGNVDVSATFWFKGRIYRILVFNRFLSADEYLQAHLAAAYPLGHVHPAVTYGKIAAFDGDSLTDSVGAAQGAGGSCINSPTYVAAQTLGIPLGAWGNYAWGASFNSSCIARVPLGLGNLYTRLGVPVRVIYEEWFNDRAKAVTGAGSLTEASTTYCTTVKAALGAANVKIMGCTPSDCADTASTANPAWSTQLRSNYASMGYDALADIASDTFIGVVGAYEANAATYWFSSNPVTDPVHLNAAGYVKRASYQSAAYTAAGF